MRKICGFVAVFALLLAVVSCATKPLPPPQFTYGKGGIMLHLVADPQLNLYQGNSHTLLICVYQLQDPNGFNQLSGDQDGLYKLLECAPFDGSVTNVKRLIVQPGQEIYFKLDRAEGTRYVGFIAGYSQLSKEKIVRLFKIPVIVKRTGLLRTSKIQKPGLLNLEILLGPQGIKEVKDLGAQKK